MAAEAMATAVAEAMATAEAMTAEERTAEGDERTAEERTAEGEERGDDDPPSEAELDQLRRRRLAWDLTARWDVRYGRLDRPERAPAPPGPGGRVCAFKLRAADRRAKKRQRPGGGGGGGAAAGEARRRVHVDVSLWEAARRAGVGAAALEDFCRDRARPGESLERLDARLVPLVHLEELRAVCSPGAPFCLVPEGVTLRLLIRAVGPRDAGDPPPGDREWPGDLRDSPPLGFLFLRYAGLDGKPGFDPYSRGHAATLPAGIFRGLDRRVAVALYRDVSLRRSMAAAGLDLRGKGFRSLDTGGGGRFGLHLSGQRFLRDLYLWHADAPMPFTLAAVLSLCPDASLGYEGPVEVSGAGADEGGAGAEAVLAVSGRLRDWETGLAALPTRVEKAVAGGIETLWGTPLGRYDRAVRKTLAALEAERERPAPAGGAPLCALCAARHADRALVPCGHVLCGPCLCRLIDPRRDLRAGDAPAADRCPWCRAPAVCAQRLYWGQPPPGPDPAHRDHLQKN